MSKKIIGIVLTVASVALIATGVGAPFGLGTIGIALGGAFVSDALLIGIGLGIAGSLLLGPSTPKGLTSAMGTDRLTATLVPTEPRKISFGGPTALGNDVRYQAFTGANQAYLEMIVCHASHAVHSIDQLWLDNELAWNGTVQGRYVGYLTVDTRTEGNSGNGIAIDSTWTSTATLTGCAYTHLKFKLTGNSDKVSSPFSSGVTSRMTFRGKGAKVYDPRLDSTVAGGSGSQRANDQTTWTWDDNASRNPALQELFYELGWKIGGKLAVGKGLPPARIDLASYAVAANACDESVTLNGGGTEPRYRSDGVVSEGDDPKAVRDNLCLTMNAMLRDNGGKLALTVIHNDLGTPVTPSGKSAFDQDDVIGEIQWDQTPDLSSIFNIVRGRMINATDTGLYQAIDFPEVSLASNDGIDRIDTIDLPFVQSNGQSQRLAKQRLERNQYQGKLTFTGKPSFWGLNLGDPFPFSHPAFGWTAKLFRCAGQTISRTGETQIVAVEENAAIYAWANNEAAAVTPGAPTVYDPLNNPYGLGIGDAGNSAAPGDSNRVRLTRLEQGTLGWTEIHPSGDTITSLTAVHDSTSDRVQLVGSFTGASHTVELLTDSAVSGNKEYRIPVTVGERLFVSANIEVTSSVAAGWSLYAFFKDDADGSVSAVAVAAGFGSLALNTREGGFVTVPAASVYVSLELHVTSNAAGAFTCSIARPMVCGAGTAQTAWPAFTPGPSAESGAEVTRWIDDPVQRLTFNYDYTGVTAQSGEFSRDILLKLMASTGQITSGITWTWTVVTGGVNGKASTDGVQTVSGAGTGTFTVSSLEADSSVQITATYLGKPYIKILSLQRVLAQLPTGGGGGGAPGTLASQTSGFFASNSTSFVAVTGSPLTGVVVPSGVSTITLNANLIVTPDNSSAGSWVVEGKWQKKVSGVWTDVDATAAHCRTDVASDGGSLYADGNTITDSQSVSVSAGTYDFQYVMRTTTGPRTHYVIGTASVNT